MVLGVSLPHSKPYPISTGKCSFYPSSKRPLLTAKGENLNRTQRRTQWAMGSPAPADTAIPQFLHVWLRERFGRWAERFQELECQEVFCKTILPRNGCIKQEGQGNGTICGEIKWVMEVDGWTELATKGDGEGNG